MSVHSHYFRLRAQRDAYHARLRADISGEEAAEESAECDESLYIFGAEEEARLRAEERAMAGESLAWVSCHRPTCKCGCHD